MPTFRACPLLSAAAKPAHQFFHGPLLEHNYDKLGHASKRWGTAYFRQGEILALCVSLSWLTPCRKAA